MKNKHLSDLKEIIEVKPHYCYVKMKLLDWFKHVELTYGRSLVCPIMSMRRLKSQDLQRLKHNRFNILNY